MSVLAVVLVLALPASAAPVEVEFSELSERHGSRLDGEALQRAAAVRLVQEGFDPHPASTTAVPQVRIFSSGERLLVRAECGEDPEEREVPLQGSAAAIRLEVVHVVVELARRCHDRRSDEEPRESAIADAPAAEPEPEPPPEPASVTPRPPRRVSVAVRAEALWRREVDGRLGLEVGIRPLEQWPSLQARLALTRASSSTLSVYEPELLLGARWERPLPAGARGTLGLSVGGGLHLWGLDGSRGTHPYVVAELGLGLQRAFGPVQLGLELSPGIASPVPRHLSGDETLWSRTPFRLGLGLWLGGRGKLPAPRGS